MDKIIGRNCWEIVHGTSEPIPECPIPGMKISRQRESMILTVGDHLYQVCVDPIIDEAGNLTGALHSMEDITERTREHSELLEAYQFNTQIIESAQEGIIVYDKELKYVVWNPFMETLTGRSAAEVLGKHPLECFPFLREAGVIAILQKTLRGETSDACRFRFNIPETGQSGYVSTIYAPLTNSHGKIVGVIGTVRDITAHVRSEEQLLHAQKMEAIGTLTGGIAHDFNNILNVIIGYSNMVLDKIETDSPLKKHMIEVVAAADKAVTLTKKLLTFSRREIADFKPVNINEIKDF